MTKKGYYNVIRLAEGTNFFFAAISEPLDTKNPAKHFYRVQPIHTQMDQVIKYSITFIPSALDIAYNYKYVLASPRDPTDPDLYLYDYTQDPSYRGTDIQPTAQRTRSHIRIEVAFISPTDIRRDWYAAVEEIPAVSVYKWSDNTFMHRHTMDQISSLLCTIYSKEIRNSNYAIVTTNSDKVVIFNYMEGHGRVVETKLGSPIISAVEMIEWRRLILAGGKQNVVAYFDLPERPCHDSVAETCDELDPRIPQKCRPNAEVKIVGDE